MLFMYIRQHNSKRVVICCRETHSSKRERGQTFEKTILQNLNYPTSETALSIYYLARGLLQKGRQKEKATKLVSEQKPSCWDVLLQQTAPDNASTATSEVNGHNKFTERPFPFLRTTQYSSLQVSDNMQILSRYKPIYSCIYYNYEFGTTASTGVYKNMRLLSLLACK